MNNKDVLVELDIKSFVKDLDKFEQELGKLKDKVENALPGITYRCASVIWEKIVDIITEKDIVLTGTLRRSVHVASPETDHSGDQEKASKRKIRLSVKDAVARIPFGCITQIGTWLRYSYWVERGTGKMKPRPYVLPGFVLSRDDVKLKWYEELKGLLGL